jgi:pyruvate formate lyase activating enzyme
VCAAVDVAGVAPLQLRVGGVVPFSTNDWPGTIAAVVFAQGCPWRCRYCHNPHLIPTEGPETHAWPGIVAWLEGRRGLLEAVVFSGGEPTAQLALEAALRDTRALGFRTGVHTGGMFPRRMPSLLPLLDWVGLDVKAPTGQYPAVTGVQGSGLGALVTLELVRQAGVAHEIRTTVHPALTPAEALVELAAELAAAGVRDWVLQPFRTAGCADAALNADTPHGATIDEPLLARLREHVPGTVVR